jgi:hypothetical protein
MLEGWVSTANKILGYDQNANGGLAVQPVDGVLD